MSRQLCRWSLLRLSKENRFKPYVSLLHWNLEDSDWVFERWCSSKKPPPPESTLVVDFATLEIMTKIPSPSMEQAGFSTHLLLFSQLLLQLYNLLLLQPLLWYLSILMHPISHWLGLWYIKWVSLLSPLICEVTRFTWTFPYSSISPFNKNWHMWLID